jgi:hypothetical protein
MAKQTRLEKRIDKDFKDAQAQANALYAFYSNEIGKMIGAANQDVVASIASTLSMFPEITYASLHQHGLIDRLTQVINSRYEACEKQITNYWSEKIKMFDLLSRVAVSFISRKVTPPWIKTRLNLKDDMSTDGLYDPRKGHLLFFFRNLTAALIKEIQRGALKEESMNQIMNRVRKMFIRGVKQGVREDVKDFGYSNFDPEKDKFTAEYKQGNMEIQEGFFSLEDIDALNNDAIKSNQWYSRQYRPWFSDELKANNRYLRDLEQFLNYNATYALQNGMLEIGSKEMGIKDFVWSVYHPQKECDECTDRDGLTMTEIKEKISDKYGKSATPPLHPNCRCQIIPKIQDSWAENILKNEDSEFSPADGIVYRAGKQARGMGISDMTMDEFLRMAGTR